MEVTIDIPDPLHRQAMEKAALQGVTLREIVLRALEHDLAAPKAARPADEPHSDVDELGVPRLRRDKDDNTVVTEDLINRLREQEGI